MKKLISAGLASAIIAALSSCAPEPIRNAPPAVVEECRREADLLTEPDPSLVRNDPMREGGTESSEVIEDARAAEAESERVGLGDWPREVLVYRCLVGEGVELTPEQAAELAEWERRLPEEE